MQRKRKIYYKKLVEQPNSFIIKNIVGITKEKRERDIKRKQEKGKENKRSKYHDWLI